MGLIKHSELETSDSIQTSLDKKIDSNNRDILTTKVHISEKFPEIYKGLLKYNTGSIINVTYYRKYSSYLNKQSENYTFSLEKADVDLSYDIIYNFEISLESALDINYNNETGEFNVEGSAYVYPRTDPKIGDIFLYNILNNNIGVFIVNNIDRLSLSSNSQYKISFNLYSFLNDEISEKLNNNIAHIYYFDKKKYQNDDIMLIDSDSYRTYNKLCKEQLMILDNYLNKFYNKESYTLTNTYFEDNKTFKYYDPFIIEYLYNSIEISKSKYSIRQLLGNIVDIKFDNTIYNALITNDIFLLNTYKYIIVKKVFDIYNTNITSCVSDYILYLLDNTEDYNDLLYNHNYIVKSSDTKYYIFSEKFYYYIDQIKNNVSDIITNILLDTTLDKLEKLVLSYFIYNDNNNTEFKDILFPTILSYKEILSTKESFNQFYYWPIIMFFLNIAIEVI